MEIGDVENSFDPMLLIGAYEVGHPVEASARVRYQQGLLGLLDDRLRPLDDVEFWQPGMGDHFIGVADRSGDQTNQPGFVGFHGSGGVRRNVSQRVHRGCNGFACRLGNRSVAV